MGGLGPNDSAVSGACKYGEGVWGKTYLWTQGTQGIQAREGAQEGAWDMWVREGHRTCRHGRKGRGDANASPGRKGALPAKGSTVGGSNMGGLGPGPV